MAEKSVDSDDDLEIELKRATQRNEILVSENALLKNELELCRSLCDQSKENSKENVADTENLSLQIHQRNAIIEKYAQKLSMISRGHVHERSILNEIKGFVGKFQDQILIEVAESMAQLVSQVQLKDSKGILKYDRLLRDYNFIVSELNAQRHEMDGMINEYCQFKGIIASQREDFDLELSALNKSLAEMEESRASDLNLFNLKLAETEADLGAVRKQKALSEEDGVFKKNQVEKLENENRELQRRVRDASATASSADEIKALLDVKEGAIKLKSDEILLLNNRVKDLQSSLSNIQSQYQRLLSTNESIQNDMNSILKREVLLRSEIGSKGIDNQEVQFKLKSIQDKLGRIERDHEDTLKQKENEKKDLEITIDTLEKSAIQSNKRIGELERSILDFSLQREQIESKNGLKISDYEMQLSRSNQELELLKGNEKSLNKTIGDLRDDRDQFEKQLAKANSSNKQLTNKSEAWTKEREKLFEENASLQKQLKQIEHNKKMELVEIADVNSLKQEISMRNEEIKGLKDTIRKECEERTHLLISISELKDKIKVLESNMSLPCHSYNIHANNVRSSSSRSQLVSGEYIDTDLQPFMKSLSDSGSTTSTYVTSSSSSSSSSKLGLGGVSGIGGSGVGGVSSEDGDDPVTSAAWLNRLQRNSSKAKEKEKKKTPKP